MAAADRVLAVTPEYNGTMPAVLNNAIDWLSRPYGAGAITGKPFAVVGATPTPYGGKWAHEHARRSAGIAGAVVLEHIEVSQPALEGDILADEDVLARLLRYALAARRPGRPSSADAIACLMPDPPRGPRLARMSELTPYICVEDARAAIEWYVDVLGAEVTYEPIEMPDGRIGHVELAVDGARLDDVRRVRRGQRRRARSRARELGIAPPHRRRRGRGRRPGGRGRRADGPRPEDSPPAGRVAVFRDPFGHRWFLNQPLG